MLFSSRLSNHQARKKYIFFFLQLGGVHQAVARSSTASSCQTTKMGVSSYPLLEKWQQSHDSWLLRFGLPTDQKFLGTDPRLPTCISVHHDSSLLDKDNNQVGLLKKSYSPISHPATERTFDLLVKAYTPVPGGGVGDAICNLRVGQSLVGKLKAERLVHGSPLIGKRWNRIGLVAGGTGIAPLIQLARIILDDPTDDTKVYLLSINRNEHDILMRKEIDQLAKDHPNRLNVSYSLTGKDVRSDWEGYIGRGSVDMAKNALPPPSSSDGKTTMIFVCGTDGFRDMWAGPIARAPPLPDGSKGPKIQGDLLGVLKKAGYEASDVFKY